MEVKAIAKNVRVSPKKAKLVIDQIKNKKPQEAVKILDFVNKKPALEIKKLIMSAIANANTNRNLDVASLFIKQISANKGLTFKRYRPISRGRVHHILKRTSHLTVVLEGEEKKKVATTETTESTEIKTEDTEDHKASAKSAVARKSKSDGRGNHGAKN